MGTIKTKQSVDFNHSELAEVYEQIKISPSIPRSLKHTELVTRLQQLTAQYPKDFKLEKVGESVEGRTVFLASLGRGPLRVFMWSQMHGDEPTATNALLDIFNYLLSHKKDPFAKELLDGITFYAIPMLNPDGAEQNSRRNAQGLDINRDARDFASPEARILKIVRDRLQPEFGFNLHDQNGRRTVGNTNKIVAIALLVPPFDENENDTPQRVEAKKIASVVYQALSPYIYGHIARYDASFMPRAFGDNMQLWGTRTVLIESGGWFEGDTNFLVKMNFIAILEACHAIATGSYLAANPGLYDAMPQNDKELFDLLIKDALIFDGVRPQPFKGDIGINYSEVIQGDRIIFRGKITDIGDMDSFAAKDTIAANDLLVVPGLIGLGVGEPVDGNGWAAAYLRNGYTTVLLTHHFAGNSTLAEKIAALQELRLPVNIGFLSSLQDLQEIAVAEQATYLGDALSDGALAVLATSQDAAFRHPLTDRIVRWMHRQQIAAADLRADKSWPEYFSTGNYDVANERADKLGLFDRGRIRIGDFADLAIYRLKGGDPARVTDADLEYVLVNGRLVYAASNHRRFDPTGMVLVR